MHLRHRLVLASFAVANAAAAGAATPAAELEALATQVRAAETAFARTMAERRFDRFAGFVAADAVFRGAALRVGKAAVLEKWKPLFEGPAAPFSWAPDQVTVAADGRTAVTTGPVRSAQGQLVSRFMSVWRKEADGRWRVIVDQGVDASACLPAAR